MNRLTSLPLYSFKSVKTANAYQRQKYYSKYPNLFKKKTLIRPPDLTDPNLTFPINIPIRFRHIYKPTKALFVDNTSKIRWERLCPNEVLLAFENLKYLTFQEVVEGFKVLSNIQSQSQINWNEHEWINNAFIYFRQNFNRIKKGEHIRFYYLMKKLNNKDELLWKKLYQKIQQNMYDLTTKDFQTLFIRYYQNPSPYLSQKFKQNSLKLMEGRIRQFSGESILKIFDIYLQNKKLNPFYIQNVFVPLFKNKAYKYSASQISRILRYMMIVQYETNDRLYNTLYSQILEMKFNDKNQLEDIIEVIEEVKQIFISHRVQNVLAYLNSQKQQLKNIKVQVKKKLHQIVKEDLIYFIQKKKLKAQIV